MLPDSEEWAIIEEIICVLKPFHRATTAMSASSYPTLSMLSPLLYKLLDIVLKVKDDTPSCKHLKEAIATDLSHRYASLDQQQMLHAAAFLDPRFHDLDPFILETDRTDVEESVKLEMLELTEQAQSEEETNTQSSESEQVPPHTKRSNLGTLSHFFSDLTGAKATRKHVSRHDVLKSELDRYNQEPLLDW